MIRVTENGIVRIVEDASVERILEAPHVANVAGAVLAQSHSLVPGQVVVDSTVAGAVLAQDYSLVPGSAAIPARYRITEDGAATRIPEDAIGVRITEPGLSAAAPGDTTVFAYSLVPGQAFTGIIAFGAVLPLAYELLPGHAETEVTIIGSDLIVTYALEAGLAQGQSRRRGVWVRQELRDVRVRGAILEIDYYLIPGIAEGEISIPASAVVEVAGFNHVFSVYLDAGTATGQKVYLIDGQVSASSTVAGTAFYIGHSISTDEDTIIDNDLLSDPIDEDECDRDFLFAA